MSWPDFHIGPLRRARVSLSDQRRYIWQSKTVVSVYFSGALRFTVDIFSVVCDCR